MLSLPRLRRRSSRGFTLIETLMATAVLGLATIGIVIFVRHALKLYYMDRARTMVNRDIRSFTSQLDNDAVTANYFCIYPGFSTRSSGTTDLSVADGQVGDFLVLIYTDPAQTSAGNNVITRIVGYYREITDTTLNTGPVHRFDTARPGWSPAIPTAGVDMKSAPMYQIINTYVTGSAASYPIVTQLAQGLATNAGGAATPTPALFYNVGGRSIMVNAQVSESLSERGATSQTGNTYNFSVSPRG